MKLQVKRQILGMCDTLREAVQYAKSAQPEQAYNVLCDAYSVVDSIKKSVSEGFTAQLADEYIKICVALQDSLENMNAALQTGRTAKEAAGKVRGKLRLLSEKLSSEEQIEKTGKMIFFMCAYNTPTAYLRKAIGSVLGQSDPDFLLLILDHGSTDGTTAKILQDYAKQDERIILFRCEKNMKLNPIDDPETFNEWKKLWEKLSAESGAEYFATIDSDDAYAADFLKEMYSAAKKENADIAVCGTTVIKENGTICADRIPPALIKKDKNISENDFICLYGSLRTHWCKLYSMHYWQRFFDLFFKMLGKNGGDTLIVLELMCEIKIFVSVPKCLHFYRVRRGSFYNKWPSVSRIAEGGQIFETGIKFAEYYNCHTNKTERFLEDVYRHHILDLFNIVKTCANNKPIEAAKFIRAALDDQLYKKVCIQNPDFLSDAMQTIAKILSYADKGKIQCILNKPVDTQTIKSNIERDIANGDYDKAMADDASFLLEAPLNEAALMFRLKIDDRTGAKTNNEKVFAEIAKTLYPESVLTNNQAEILTSRL